MRLAEEDWPPERQDFADKPGGRGGMLANRGTPRDKMKAAEESDDSRPARWWFNGK